MVLIRDSRMCQSYSRRARAMPAFESRNPSLVLVGLEEGRLSPVEAIQALRTSYDSHAKKREMETESPDSSEWRLNDALSELDSLIGLTAVKALIRELVAYVRIQRIREMRQLASEALVLHMVFSGNPGTGKTTCARLMGKIFREMGVLEKGHLVERERADLVGEYIGHTAQKTREQIKKALGGILFIDEAYSLATGGDKDFGKESISTLIKAMEDNRDRFIVILAGYREEMAKFIQSNPGIRSRFPIHIEFPDYTTEELMLIADLMLKKRDYRLDLAARARLEAQLSRNLGPNSDHSGNARLVRNIIERAIRRQALRLVDKKPLTREELMLIRREDIEGNHEAMHRFG
jgi:stage V sporulation protein K